jgi:signal transduction histidine kinase/CheY-like chemotaxis protein
MDFAAVRQDPKCAAAVLECVHGMLCGREETPVAAELLRKLASAFDVDAAGLKACSDVVPINYQAWLNPPESVVFPWESDHTLAARLPSGREPLAFESRDGGWWLIAGIAEPTGESWLVWLRTASNRAWTHEEKGALVLAGRVLLESIRGARPFQAVVERVRLHENLARSAHVVARLAHDFGNLLTGILGFAELGLAQLAPETLPRRYVQEILNAAHSGAEWVRKLQLFSRRSKGMPQASALLAIVAEEENRRRQTLPDNVKFFIAVPDDLPELSVSKEALRQLVQQILDNAQEAVGAEGIITLSARTMELSENDAFEFVGNTSAGPHVEITMTDTGVGLDSETAQRLCDDLFYSTKPRHRGLGLPMAFGILQSCRGGIRFDPGPERGTAVRVAIPVVARPSGNLSMPAAGGTSARILAVDDDPVVLEMVCKVLQHDGHRVSSASSASEAIGLFTQAQEPFRLVISDVIMPGMNGIQMARKLRAQNARARFLFLTGPQPSLAAEEITGDFPVLKKPFDPAALVRAVNTALEQPESFCGQVVAGPSARLEN